MVPNLGIFVFLRNFEIRQIRWSWFKIWQYNFQLPVQKYPNQVFLVPNLRIFTFAPNFAARQIWGRWFQIWQQYFQVPVPNFFPNLRIFIFCTKLCNKANSRVLISNMTMVFQNCCPKHPNKVFSVPNLRILIFTRNFAIRQFGGRWLEIWQ